MMLMFSQELIWRGEICYTNVVVSRLILKMRSEDTFLEKWCISLPFHSVTVAIKADHEAAEHFVCHRGPSSKDSEKWLSLYANLLRSILYCYLLTFEKLSMLIGSEVFSIFTYLLSENQLDGNSDHWRIRSSHKNLIVVFTVLFLQLFVFVLYVGDLFKKSFTDQSVIKDLFGKWTIFNKPWRLWQIKCVAIVKRF